MGACLPVPAAEESKAAASLDIDRVVLDLKLQRDQLTRERARLVLMHKDCRAQALLLKQSGDTRRALLVLRKAQLVDAQVTKLDDCLIQVEQLALNIESQTTTNAVLSVLSSSNDALKQIQAHYTPAFVDDLMADVTEAREHHLEVSAALAGGAPVVDDALLELEFAQLLDVKLPAVPTQKIVSAETQETPSSQTLAPVSPAAPSLPIASSLCLSSRQGELADSLRTGRGNSHRAFGGVVPRLLRMEKAGVSITPMSSFSITSYPCSKGDEKEWELSWLYRAL